MSNFTVQNKNIEEIANIINTDELPSVATLTAATTILSDLDLVIAGTTGFGIDVNGTTVGHQITFVSTNNETVVIVPIPFFNGINLTLNATGEAATLVWLGATNGWAVVSLVWCYNHIGFLNFNLEIEIK